MEKAVDTAVETVDTEKIDVNLLQERLNSLETRNAYLQEETDKYKAEAKKAFIKRDEVKEKLRDSGDVNNKRDMEEFINTLKSELDQKNAALDKINKQTLFNEKKSVISAAAKAAGLKETYNEKIDMFLNFDDVDIGRKTSIQYHIDMVKSNFPDLFMQNGEKVSGILNTPNLKSDPGTMYSDLYKKEMKKSPQSRDVAKMVEWRQLMEEDKQ